MKAVTYIEVETPPFADGSPPGSTAVWRFVQPSASLPSDIDAIQSISEISIMPAVISLGENLGQRATVRIAFTDHRHVFDGEPFGQGTFWGKWRGRYGTQLRGKPLRVIRGLVGQSLAQMEVWHFIIEATNGPTPQGEYTITGTDALKLADSDRAIAPRPNNGFLVGDILAEDTEATLGPLGIGDFEYPAEGLANIGGKEVCAFTREGDILTLTRSELIPGFSYETEVVEHKAGSRVQVCLPIIAQDPADIIALLLESYAAFPTEYIPLVSWQTETSSFLQQVYTTLICEPTGVNKLISELIEQSALAVWWSARQRLLRLQVLRAISTLAETFTESTWLQGTLRTQEQPNTRLSEVLTYFALRNPLKPVDQPDNYLSALVTPDLDAEIAYGGVANKTIYSRWIPFGGRLVASRLNTIKLSRFRDPPRRFNFSLFRGGSEHVAEGGGYRLAWTANQDQAGNPIDAPIQVVRLNPQSDRQDIEAEEMLFTVLDPADLSSRTIIIDSNINNINLRGLHDNLYPSAIGDESPPVTVRFVIEPNVIVGSIATDRFACVVGDWPGSIVPFLEIRGRIQGRGGRGGPKSVEEEDFDGFPGGPALHTRVPIDLDISDGEIFGGGGGGAAFQLFGAGGGGAGQIPGDGGSGTHPDVGEIPGGFPGTTEEGGQGGSIVLEEGLVLSGADGGAPGEPGAPAMADEEVLSEGGAAGLAVDGISFINIVAGPGDIRGDQIN
jgi:hypothetical protein